MSIYKKGYSYPKQRAEEAKKSGKNKGLFLQFKDGDSFDLVFIEPEPISFDAHRFFNKANPTASKTYVCINEEEDCAFCEDNHKTSVIVIYKVYNFTEKKVQIWQTGINNANTLSNLHKKGRLANMKFEVTRSGAGKNDTAYSFYPKKKVKIPDSIKEEASNLKSKIKKYFPIKSVEELQKIAEEYSGNTDDDD